METVEVVIKLPKEDYAQYKSIAEWMISNNFNTNNTLTKLQICIANGTVLPKGHGKLVDVDEVEAILHNKAFDMVESNAKFYTIRWVQKIVRNAPTVIEADKE